MIGKLSGRYDTRATDHILLDVGGVGYVVYCSERTIASLPAIGSHVALYTDLLVREDNLQLFGFLTMVDKEWHRLLTTVQGVGAKAALAISGTLGSDGVSRAIALGDVAAIKAAPGVGPKIAQRVVTELKDKAATVMALSAEPLAQQLSDDVIDTGDAAPAVTPAPTAAPRSPGAQADALSALINLGYAHSDAASAVAQANGDAPDADAQSLIKAALRLLAPRER